MIWDWFLIAFWLLAITTALLFIKCLFWATALDLLILLVLVINLIVWGNGRFFNPRHDDDGGFHRHKKC